MLLTLTQTTPAVAQASATAQIGATIVTPITVSKESDLEFQHITTSTKRDRKAAKSATQNAVATRSIIKGSISISGLPNYSYSITIPASVTVAGGAQHLTIGTEACAASGSQVLSTQGQASISIEGSVSIAAKDAVVSNTEFPNGLPVTINNY